MKKVEQIEVDPEVAAFFKGVVPEAFDTIKKEYLSDSVLSKISLVVAKCTTPGARGI